MSRSRRVLVIEKDPETLRELAASLENEGFDVTRTSKSQEALHFATSGSFDAALLNFRMPGLLGLDLLRPLKGRTPVVVFSPEISDATREKAMEEGAASVISGPVNYTEILGALDSALNPHTLGPRALVAGNDKDSRFFIAEILKEEGYQVITAQDGQEALNQAVCSPVPFDVCIIDVVLPSLSGVKLIEQIHEIHPSTHIICTAGSASRDEIRQCYQVGARELWLKPFEAEKMRTSLHQTERAPKRSRRKTRIIGTSWLGRVRQRLDRHKGSKAFLRATWQLAVMMLILVSIVGTILYFKGYLRKPIRRIEGFMQRMEGYLERDEGREVDRERDR